SYFEKLPEVTALYIFGSFDTPFERADSDIDVAVLVSRENKNELEVLKSEYYNASPRFSMRTVDIVILNTAATYLKHRILKTGRVMIDKNPSQRKEFAAMVLQEYFDYKPIEDLCFRKLKSRFSRTAHG
ncbi:MAG: nucleotidyltransferase domain-containing protein, partial [Deltaproteobacteria bacterium]|nr:nucleotidyltransferase domain-containing protein [Deltaproteobacteria bacterium]